MATPIKETPILTGKDAVRFLEALRGDNPRPSAEEIAKMKENYQKLSSIYRGR